MTVLGAVLLNAIKNRVTRLAATVSAFSFPLNCSCHIQSHVSEVYSRCDLKSRRELHHDPRYISPLENKRASKFES